MIETIYAERIEEFYEMLAYHYSKAEDYEKAAHYLKLSGIKAVGKHSPWEAFRYYKDAISAIKQLPDSDENIKAQIEVSLLMYSPMMFLGQPEGALEILHEGGRLSRELSDERSLATFYSRMALYYHQIGDALPGVKYGEKAYRTAEKMDDVGFMATTAFDLINAYWNMGHFAKIVDVCKNVIDLLEETSMEEDLCAMPFPIYPVLCGYCGASMGCLGDFVQGEEICEKGLRMATSINHPAALGLTEATCAIFWMVKGDGKRAMGHIQDSIRYAEELNWAMLLYSSWIVMECVQWLLGDLEAALESFSKALEIQKGTGAEMLLSQVHLFMGAAYSDQGNPEDGLTRIKEALGLARKNSEKGTEGLSMVWLGRMLGQMDASKRDEAKASILQGIDILEALKVRPWFSQGHLYLGEFYADSGEKEKALENLKIAETNFQEMGMDYWLTKTQEVLARL
ncbi:hypothetical protein ACFL0Q_01405 [Thermodesulfobacteriota bacterium]